MSINPAQEKTLINQNNLNVSQAAALLGISPSTLRRLEQNNEIQAQRGLNNYRYFLIGDVLKLKEKLQSDQQEIKTKTVLNTVAETNSNKITKLQKVAKTSQIGAIAFSLMILLLVIFLISGTQNIQNIKTRLLAKSDATNTTHKNVLASKTQLPDYILNVNIPATFNQLVGLQQQLSVAGLATFTGGINTTSLTFTGTGIINNLLALDNTSKSTLEQQLEVTGTNITGLLNNVEISELNEENFADEIDYSGDWNFSGTWSVDGEEITVTAEDINALAGGVTPAILEGTTVTNGGVMFGNGSIITQDASNFFWDNSNDYLGIRTNSPAYPLDIAGDLHISAGSDILIGTIGIGDTTPTSGASLIGVYDELSNSSATNVQDVLDDLDAAIGGGSSKFTQDTGFIYLTNDTDEVVIGSNTSLSSKLAINGDANEIQLKVQGNATQSASLLVLEQSDGTDVFTVSNTGNLALNGTVDGRDIANDGNNLDNLYTTIGLSDLTSGEVNQLENIGTTTVSATQWGYLGALNQGLTTTSDITFNDLVLSADFTLGGYLVNDILDEDTLASDSATALATQQSIKAYVDSQIASTGTIDGTGVANYTARFSDSNTLTTGLIYDDSTSVGIGTTLPNNLLELQSSSTAQLRLSYPATNQYTTLQVASDGGLTWTALGNDADLNFDLTGATDGDFSVNTDDLFVDTSTGRVGINDATPSYTLDVTGTGQFTGDVIFGEQISLGNTSINNNRYLNSDLSISTGTLTYGLYSSISNSSAATVIAGHNSTRSTATSGSSFLYGTFNAANNASSGTASQTFASSNQTTNSSSGTTTNAYGTYNSISNSSNGTITDARVVRAIGQNTSTGTITSNTLFHGTGLNSNASGTIGTLYGLRLDSWSNSGTINTSYGIYMDTSIDVGSTKFALYSSSTSTSFFDGSLGLGTTNPASKLDVQGGIRLGANTDTDNILNTSATAGAPSGDLFWGSREICDNSGNCAGSGAGIGGSGTQNYISKFSDQYEITDSLLYDNGSALGLGTTSPTSLLTIAPTTAAALQLNPYDTAAGNTAELRFLELAANGSNYTGFKSPDSLASNLIYTLPTSVGSADYVLTWQTGNALQWKEVSGVGGVGDITAVGDVISGEAFTSVTPGNELYFADAGFLGIGSTAARIEFDDATTDEISFLGANIGVGTTAPTALFDVAGNFTVDSSGDAVGNSFNGLTLNEAADGFSLAGGTSSERTLSVSGGDITLSLAGAYTLTIPATGTAALGTGTSGYVGRWTGTNTLGTGIIYDNSTAVGIGTTGPNDLLELLSTSDAQLRLAYDTSNYSAFQIASDGGLTWSPTGTDADINIDFSSGGSGADFSINSDDLFVDSSAARVGINDSTPSYALDVTGTGQFTGDVIFGEQISLGNTSINNNRYLNLEQNIATTTLTYGTHSKLTNSSAGTVVGSWSEGGGTSSGGTNTLYGAYNLAITSGSGAAANAYGTSSRVRHTGTGNIGTIAYGSYNSVDNEASGTIADARVVRSILSRSSSGSVTTGSLFHGTIVNASASNSIGTAYGLRLDGWTNSGTINTSYGIYMDTSIDVGSTKYALYSTSTSDSYLAGNFGLGDASPSALLTVGSGDAFQVNSSGTIAAATGITSSGSISFTGLSADDALNTAVLALDASNNVELLDISAVTLPSGTEGQLLYNNAGTWTAFSDLYWNDTTNSLGIGVTSPNAFLDIKAATTGSAQLNLTTSGGTNPSSPVSGDLWWNGTNLYFYNGSSSTDLVAAGASGDITAVGSATSGDAFTSGAPGSSLFFADDGYLGLGASAGRIEFDDQTTDEVNILSALVGIGTSTPGRRLDILDPSNPQLRLTQANASVYADFQVTSAGDLIMGLDGTTNQLVLDNGGNIGIGTSAPTGLLNILGTSEQFRLSYDTSNYLSFTVDSAGNLTFADTGTNVATFGATQASFAVPTAFNAAGDISIAYDQIFTNQTSAGIESYGPLSITAGESFESNNLTLQTYNSGDLVVNLGVGSTATGAQLAVSGNTSGFLGSFFNDGNADTRQGLYIQGCLDSNPTSSCNFMEFRDGDGTALGAIEGNGAGSITYGTSGADYAELFKGDRNTIRPGDIIALGNGEQVVKATPNTKIIGAYSTKPGSLGNWFDGWENQSDYVPVGLLGQLYVNVSIEKGAIDKGDPVAISNKQPGVGVKATEPSRIVGFALESTPKNMTKDEVKQIKIYISPTWYDPLLYADEEVQLAALSENLGNVSGEVLSLQTEISLLKELIQQQTSTTQSTQTTQSSTAAESFNLLGQMLNIVDEFKTFVDSLDLSLKTDDEGNEFLLVGADLNVTGDTSLNDVFVNGSLMTGALKLDSIENSIDILGTECYNNITKIHNTALCNTQTLFLQKGLAGNIDIFDGKIIIEPNGKLTIAGTIDTQKIVTEEINIKTTSNQIGSAILFAGETEIVIQTNAVKENAKIFITPTNSTNGQVLYVSKKLPNKAFIVTIDTATLEDIYFDWWIVNVE